MSRVSVAEGSKPKPKESFKFLRRDEGRLSYAAAGTADSPSRSATTTNSNTIDGDKMHRERRDSKSLREAIAFDMRNAKSHDPLGEVVVAVPRKAPPPNRAASTPPPPPSSTSESSRSPQQQQQQQHQTAQQPRRPPASAAAKKKPEWVNPEIPPARPASAGRFDYDAPPRTAAAASSDSIPRSAGRGGADEFGGAEFSRYGGHTPRRAGSGVSAQRYTDPDVDDVSASDRNYFRRPPSSTRDGSAVSSRAREEEDLMLNLEQEIRAAQEEREHYATAKQQLDREKQRFEAYRYSTQQQLEDERANTDGSRARDQRDAQKDLRAVEERHRNVSALLVTEREANRRLSQENDSLRAQLEDLTSMLRERENMHKVEVARMRRDVESLTRRNAELLAMAKEQQIAALEEKATPNTAPVLRRGNAASAARERTAAPSLDAQELTANDRKGSVRRNSSSNANNNNNGSSSTPPVMDFTPRADAADEAAREKRNRQMQERMRAEEAAMEERRRQRESVAAERRRAEEDAAVAAAAEDEERRRRREAQQRQEEEAEAKRQQQLEKERREREASAASTAASAKPVDERKAAGHPAHTPRMQAGGAAVMKRRPSAGAPHPPMPPKSTRSAVPTREELLGDAEPAPAEDVANDTAVSQTALGDNPNKKETLYRSGKREIHYANGTVKSVLPSGHTILHFTNGDVKCTFPSGKSTYWYDAAQTMHTQMPDGVQTFEFRTTGQAERHTPDGGKSILYPDGIYKVVHPDGSDETFYPDGEPMEESQ